MKRETYIIDCPYRAGNNKFLSAIKDLIELAGMKMEAVTLSEETEGVAFHKDDHIILHDIADQMESYNERSYKWVLHGLPEEVMDEIRGIVVNSYEWRSDNVISPEEAAQIDELLKGVSTA